MTLKLRELAPAIGAEILGVELSKPLSPEAFAEIHETWLNYAILLFRNQEAMSPEDHLRFSSMFGEIDLPDTPDFTLKEYPLIAVVSNVKENGRHIGAPNAGRHWHSDSQFLETPPSASLLLGREVPPAEGDTAFANMYAAYDGLDEETRRFVDKLKVNHSRIRAYSVFHPERPPLSEAEKARVPDVVHPMVRVHPETKRKALYVGGPQHGGSVVGMEPQEGETLLHKLRRHATQPAFSYVHHWRTGDLIVWDNRCTMHCAMPFNEKDHRRIMHRTQIVGGPVFAS
jgi:taurine dioxygenase